MNMKRMRGRNHRGGSGGGGGGGPIRHQSGNVPLNRNHVFDSQGPDLRIRGTSQQLFEKYLQMGRDATSSGDRVMAESYFQYAEHYFRILSAMNQAVQQGQPQQGQGGQQGEPAQAGGRGQANGQHRRGDYTTEPEQQNEDEMEPAVVEQRPIPITAGVPDESAA